MPATTVLGLAEREASEGLARVNVWNPMRGGVI